MTDHNARQAGQMLTIDEIDTIKQHAYRDGFKEAQRMLAAHSADARNGEGVAVELIELLRAIHPEFGAVGSRDVDVRAQQNRIDRAIELLAAPAAPVPAPAAQADEQAGPMAALFKHAGYLTICLRTHKSRLDDETFLTLGKVEDALAAVLESRQQSATPAPAAQADVEELQQALLMARQALMDNGLTERGLPRVFRIIDEALAGQQSATPPECTCPSGNGSLRHPCPVHAVDPVQTECQRVFGEACKYAKNLATGEIRCIHCGSATPADAASEADKSDARFEVRVDGNIVAGTDGPHDDALRDATHYFYQYVDEAETEIELVQVSRVLHIDRGAARASLDGRS